MSRKIVELIQPRAVLTGLVVFLFAYFSYSILIGATSLQEITEGVPWLHRFVLFAIYILSGFVAGRMASAFPFVSCAIVGLLASYGKVAEMVAIGAPVSVTAGQVVPPVFFVCVGGLVASRTKNRREAKYPNS
jgi:hypothetical protein